MLNFLTYKKPTIDEIDDYKKKITPKVIALLDLVDGIKGKYETFNEGSKKEYKSFIETEIGAGIWYINKVKKILWSGKISEKALYEIKHNPNVKLCEEHFNPRKVSAVEVLSTEWSSFENPQEEFINRFLSKYGKFHYVTKNENKIVAKFQKIEDFISPEDSYQKAGIKLIDWMLHGNKVMEQNDEKKPEESFKDIAEKML